MAKAEKTENRGVVLMIKGTPVRVTYETIALSKVRLDPENPRVRVQIRRQFGKKKIPEAQLIEVIREQPGFAHLQRAIRNNNGLHDPLIVRHDYTVAEGNSRAAVLNVLHAGKTEDERWHSLPVMRLPASVKERVIAALLASYHVGGKTPWRPFAKAEHLTRLNEEHGLTIDEIADATRMSPSAIEQAINAFKYFENELAPGADANLLKDKFSHALEFTKRKNLAVIRDDPEKRALVTKLIRTGKIKGQEVRDLDKVAANDRAWEALKKGGFAGARKVLEKRDPTVSSKFLKQMKKLTETLDGLPNREVETIRSNPVAAEILVDLHAKLEEIAAVARVSVGATSGTTHAATT